VLSSTICANIDNFKNTTLQNNKSWFIRMGEIRAIFTDKIIIKLWLVVVKLGLDEIGASAPPYLTMTFHRLSSSTAV
jgi:hypothetical protein